jgi:DNA-binding IclR family transcriptional regulator
MPVPAKDAQAKPRAARRGTSPRNRSLERGLEILRVFRPGASCRGNNEIAERTGLPRSTVSRLTQTLVACRFLHYDRAARAYRLGAPVLSLAEAYLVESELLPVAVPLMKRVAEKFQVNVGLAVADGDELVYLHAIRRSVGGVPRHVTTGHRVPVESTAIGRAYLSTLDAKELDRALRAVRPRHKGRWRVIEAGIRKSIRQLRREGYCLVEWLPGMKTVATAVEFPFCVPYLVNLSVKADQCDDNRMRKELAPELLRLATKLREALAGQSAAAR